MHVRGTTMMGRMNEWAAWQRWSVWLIGWVLYVGAFWMLLAKENVVVRAIGLLGVCAGLWVLTYSSKAVLNERVRNIDRWQMRVVMPAFLVYMLVVLYVMPLADRLTLPWLKAIVVLSPMLPVLFIAWAVIRYVNRCDEMERRQHLEAAGLAVVIVSVVCMAMGCWRPRSSLP